MNSNIIIGGGISGLIYAFYNPEFKIITEDVGGLLNEEHDFGNMILWDTPETRNLLKDLLIYIQQAKENIYYYFNDKIYTEAPEILRKEYLLKRMGSLSHHIDFKDLALSTDEKNYMDSLKVDFSELINKLKIVIINREQIIKGKVVEINDDEVFFKNDNGIRESRKYGQLVSTIPAFVFWKLWTGKKCNEVCDPKEFEFNSTTYFSMKKPEGKIYQDIFEPKHLPIDFRYSIYFLDGSDYHRMTRTSGSYYSVHFTGEISIEDGAESLDVDIDKLVRRVEKIGNFISHKGNIPPNNIVFLGRHAQWDYKIKIQDIVRISRYSKFMFNEMRNRQSRFNKNFMSFNEITFKDKQRLTEKWILYVMSELDELLRETDWKLHKPAKELSREKIVGEYIDVLKFVLGIADIWGITNVEISRGFYEKSKLVEELYQKNKEKLTHDNEGI